MVSNPYSNLDVFLHFVAECFEAYGDGLWIEAPKEKNNLWLVARTSEMTNPDRIWSHRNLADALAKVLYHLNGTQVWPECEPGSDVERAGRTLARLGDSFMVSQDGDTWIVEAEKNRVHAVGEDLLETLTIFRTTVETLVAERLYKYDNCPLD